MSEYRAGTNPVPDRITPTTGVSNTKLICGGEALDVCTKYTALATLFIPVKAPLTQNFHTWQLSIIVFEEN